MRLLTYPMIAEVLAGPVEEECEGGCGLSDEDCALGARGSCRQCSVCGGRGKCKYDDCGEDEAEPFTAEDLHLEAALDELRGLDQ